MSVSEIERMTTSERLQAMERLWDALCHDPTEPDSPAWHQEELDRRRTKVESGNAEFLSIEEAKKRLQQ